MWNYNADNAPVNILLKQLLQKHYAEEYAKREDEMRVVEPPVI